MKLYVTRHGQTDWNEQGRIQGKIDIPLNEQGRAQARKTRDLLAHTPFDVIITSPLQRAVETATIINEAHGVKQYEDERLSERGFGTWEGHPYQKLTLLVFGMLAMKITFLLVSGLRFFISACMHLSMNFAKVSESMF